MKSNYGQLSYDNTFFVVQENASKLQSCRVFDNFYILIVNIENSIIAQCSTGMQYFNTIGVLYYYVTTFPVALTGYNSMDKGHDYKKYFSHKAIDFECSQLWYCSI